MGSMTVSRRNVFVHSERLENTNSALWKDYFPTTIKPIALHVENEALKIKDPIACGLLTLQLAHGPRHRACDAMLDIVENYLRRCLEIDKPFNPLLTSLLILGSRKRDRKLAPQVEDRAIDALNRYLSGNEGVDDPKAAAVVSLLTTVSNSDHLAAKAQEQLRNSIADYLYRQDLEKVALAVFGASPFLKSTDIENSIKLITVESGTSKINSVVSLSYCLLAAHFARHLFAQETKTIIENITPNLMTVLSKLSCCLPANYVDAHDTQEVDIQNEMWTILRKCALALIALHQVGVVDLGRCSSNFIAVEERHVS